jgi:hypothetical protein
VQVQRLNPLCQSKVLEIPSGRKPADGKRVMGRLEVFFCWIPEFAGGLPTRCSALPVVAFELSRAVLIPRGFTRVSVRAGRLSFLEDNTTSLCCPTGAGGRRNSFCFLSVSAVQRCW